jgi:predicted RNA methylase
MFVAKAGAKLVYAVDACPTICHLAEELIKCNRLQEKIQVINKRIEDIEKFDENIDIIISEWMGMSLQKPQAIFRNHPFNLFRFLSLP